MASASASASASRSPPPPPHLRRDALPLSLLAGALAALAEGVVVGVPLELGKTRAQLQHADAGPWRHLAQASRNGVRGAYVGGAAVLGGGAAKVSGGQCTRGMGARKAAGAGQGKVRSCASREARAAWTASRTLAGPSTRAPRCSEVSAAAWTDITALAALATQTCVRFIAYDRICASLRNDEVGALACANIHAWRG
jgi:hypothetical protein